VFTEGRVNAMSGKSISDCGVTQGRWGMRE
jgi:hypothetical protein